MRLQRGLPRIMSALALMLVCLFGAAVRDAAAVRHGRGPRVSFCRVRRAAP